MTDSIEISWRGGGLPKKHQLDFDENPAAFIDPGSFSRILYY